MYHIVSIWVSKYQEPDADLEFASEDAKRFYWLIKKNLPQIGYSKILTDNEASLSAIKVALGKELINIVDDDDVFFMFYSGHWTISKDFETNELMHYLIPFDGDADDIDNSCISVNEVVSIFRRVKAKQKYLFIDACFSGWANNVKSFPQLKEKHFSNENIKTFQAAFQGEDVTTITACSANEKAYEVPILSQGLFTYFLLKHLCNKKDKEDTLVVSDIFTPLVKDIQWRLDENRQGKKQTPTLVANRVWNATLPFFSPLEEISPTFIETPIQVKSEVMFYKKNEVKIDDKELWKIILEMSNFVYDTWKIIETDKMAFYTFQNYCSTQLEGISTKWEEIFKTNSQNIDNLWKAIGEIEAASSQFQILGCLIVLFGNETQMKIFANYLNRILLLSGKKAGLIAMCDMPEIIVAESIYIILVASLSQRRLKEFNFLANIKVESYHNGNKLITFLEGNRHLFYSQTFEGSASNLLDHIIEYFSNSKRVNSIIPLYWDDEEIKNMVLQANFILSYYYHSKNERFWPHFWRYFAYRVKDIMLRIKSDKAFSKDFYELLWLASSSELVPKLKELTAKIKEMVGHEWNSIHTSDFDEKIN